MSGYVPSRSGTPDNPNSVASKIKEETLMVRTKVFTPPPSKDKSKK